MSRKRVKSPFLSIGQFLLYLAVLAFWQATRIVPLSLLKILAGSAARLAWAFLPRRRSIALNNLNLALGRERAPGELRQVARRSLANFSRGFIEVLYYCRYPKRLELPVVSVLGLNNLEWAIAQKKGVVASSAHLGNFVLAIIKLTLMGYPVNVVIRNPKNERLASFLDRLRSQLGIKGIPDQPQTECTRRCLEALRRNEVLFLQIDIHAGSDPVYVEFFGTRVPAFKGPAVLALRTGCCVLPIHDLLGSDGFHQVIIGPPVDFQTTGDRARDVEELTGLLTKITEDYIRRYPEQWLWIHQRFRKALPPQPSP